MFLLPGEQEAMLKRLASKNIPINGIKANPSKTLQALLSKTPELKVRCCVRGLCQPGETLAPQLELACLVGTRFARRQHFKTQHSAA